MAWYDNPFIGGRRKIGMGDRMPGSEFGGFGGFDPPGQRPIGPGFGGFNPPPRRTIGPGIGGFDPNPLPQRPIGPDIGFNPRPQRPIGPIFGGINPPGMFPPRPVGRIDNPVMTRRQPQIVGRLDDPFLNYLPRRRSRDGMVG